MRDGQRRVRLVSLVVSVLAMALALAVPGDAAVKPRLVLVLPFDAHSNGALDAALLGGTTINGGNYRVRGLEISVVGRIGSGLTVEVGAAWNHSELTKEASFLWANGSRQA